jgi:multidrug efflux system membrane fusion protein
MKIKNAPLAGALLLLVAAVAGCNQKKVQSAPPATVPVVVSTAEQKDVPVEVRAIGNVEAESTVGVKAQITAELVGVHFQEGQDVKKGDLLFTFDRRQIEADLKRAESTLARDEAQWKNARVQAERYQKLLDEGVVAREQYDQIISNSEALEATVLASRAAVENARVQLTYTRIYSPINGRTGTLLVHQGNIVKANADDPMVTINQIEPVNVLFSVPEAQLSDVKRFMREGKLKVESVIPTEPDKPLAGHLQFVDNTVDPATGTIKLKATFPNKERRLWPGQFVDVVLTLTEQPNAVVVPSQAVQTSQAGQYVYVIKEDMTAESRPVAVGRTVRGQTVIEKGVNPGERVVIDGHLRLVPGAKVELKSARQQEAPPESRS